MRNIRLETNRCRIDINHSPLKPQTNNMFTIVTRSGHQNNIEISCCWFFDCKNWLKIDAEGIYIAGTLMNDNQFSGNQFSSCDRPKITRKHLNGLQNNNLPSMEYRHQARNRSARNGRKKMTIDTFPKWPQTDCCHTLASLTFPSTFLRRFFFCSLFMCRIVCISCCLIYDFIVTTANLFRQCQICHLSISDCNDSFCLLKKKKKNPSVPYQIETKAQHNRIGRPQHHYWMIGNAEKIRFFLWAESISRFDQWQKLIKTQKLKSHFRFIRFVLKSTIFW